MRFRLILRTIYTAFLWTIRCQKCFWRTKTQLPLPRKIEAIGRLGTWSTYQDVRLRHLLREAHGPVAQACDMPILRVYGVHNMLEEVSDEWSLGCALYGLSAGVE